jgi:hypothetical protein
VNTWFSEEGWGGTAPAREHVVEDGQRLVGLAAAEAEQQLLHAHLHGDSEGVREVREPWVRSIYEGRG